MLPHHLQCLKEVFSNPAVTDCTIGPFYIVILLWIARLYIFDSETFFGPLGKLMTDKLLPVIATYRNKLVTQLQIRAHGFF